MLICRNMTGVWMKRTPTRPSNSFRNVSRLNPASPISHYLCATNEDVVEGDVDQLDDVSDKTHDQDWEEEVSICLRL